MKRLLALTFFPALVFAKTNVSSPDKSILVSLDIKDGIPHWSAQADGERFLKPSPIEIFQGSTESALKFELDSVDFSSHQSTWKPTWGQFSEVENHYNEVVLELTPEGHSQPVSLTVRASDEGIAVRYSFVGSEAKMGDHTGLNFGGDYTLWAANGEYPNHGPLALSQWDSGKPLQAPLTIKASDNLYLGIIEAASYHQYPFSVNRVEGTSYETRSSLSSWENGEGQSSWRTILVERDAGGLTTNQLIWNLNPPSQIEDTSWIKPGFTLWDWRAWGAKTDEGFMYDLDMESWRRFIDFAAKHDNVRYLMLDANWYGPEFDERNDPKVSRDHILEQLADGEVVRKEAPKDWKDPIDVPAIIKYGQERGVGIILYINDKARIHYDFEETLATYAKWGAAGIKYGFMATNGDRKVAETRYIVEACAKHKLICDFHDGPIPGSGDERTWPNYVTREFCHAQSDGKRSFTPGHFVTTVFNNGMTGSLDMANGLYAIEGAEERPRIFEKVETTVVGETARTLISYASVAILPDLPEAYEAKADLFEFISSSPMNWDETLTQNAEIGKHFTVVRRSGNQWWVASATNEEARELSVDLSFLPEGTTWNATFYEDESDTHYQTNPETYKVRKQEVKAGEKVTIKMAPGGGHCLKLTPAS